ncbi:hypothetical protein ACU686_40265 [Yinghuangia aomiensis]
MDDAPSALDWLREQLRRKGEGEAASGIRGLRVSKELAVALVLAVVVIILVLTSKNGGTPAKSAANSASQREFRRLSGRNKPTAQPAALRRRQRRQGATTKHSLSGTAGCTCQQRALFLREKRTPTAGSWRTSSRHRSHPDLPPRPTRLLRHERPRIETGTSSTGVGEVGYIPDMGWPPNPHDGNWSKRAEPRPSRLPRRRRRAVGVGRFATGARRRGRRPTATTSEHQDGEGGEDDHAADDRSDDDEVVRAAAVVARRLGAGAGNPPEPGRQRAAEGAADGGRRPKPPEDPACR